MSAREAFGPNLRRVRIQRGISLDQIVKATKVNECLWAGLERNDCSRWPTGIFARAHIRQYAHLVGVDPESTVDEFCRYFPQGDRRAERTIREHAQIVGQYEVEWVDPLPPVAEGDRRASGSTGTATAPAPWWIGALTTFSQVFVRLRRTFDRA